MFGNIDQGQPNQAISRMVRAAIQTIGVFHGVTPFHASAFVEKRREARRTAGNFREIAGIRVDLQVGALHLFSDLSAALTEMHRVLKPGGQVTATAYRNWIPGEIAKKLVAWHYRVLGTNYFHAVDLEAMLLNAGFYQVVCHHDTRYWIILSARKPA
jgi:SAM-dependent methyltransferase